MCILCLGAWGFKLSSKVTAMVGETHCATYRAAVEKWDPGTLGEIGPKAPHILDEERTPTVKL